MIFSSLYYIISLNKKIFILFIISAQFDNCVYITLQHLFRELVSSGGLQTSRFGGRREYETVGRAPTCFTSVGRLLLTQTVGRIFYCRVIPGFFVMKRLLDKYYNIVVANILSSLYNIFVFQSIFCIKVW